MEERLGGLVTDVVRVGDTVRRRVYRDLDVGFGEEILRRLEVAAFDAAPRFLGHDEHGRQVLSFVDGHVRPAPLSEDDLIAVFGVIRRFHDLTDGRVCHNDLAPRNTIWRSDGSGPVLVDWDLAAEGRPLEDVAHACWQYVGLGPSVALEPAARRVRVAVDAYGLGGHDRSALVGEILAWQQRCADGIEERAAQGHGPWMTLVRRGAAAEVRAAREWVGDHRRDLDAALA